MMYGNITNINDMINMFLTFTIDPLADMIGEEITRKMYPFSDWKAGNYVKVDTSCISHVDILDVADKVDKAVSSGVVCVDEMRKRLDMEELGTEFGKTHFVTKNYSTSEDALKGEPEPVATPLPPAPNGNDNTAQSDNNNNSKEVIQNE